MGAGAARLFQNSRHPLLLLPPAATPLHPPSPLSTEPRRATIVTQVPPQASQLSERVAGGPPASDEVAGAWKGASSSRSMESPGQVPVKRRSAALRTWNTISPRVRTRRLAPVPEKARSQLRKRLEQMTRSKADTRSDEELDAATQRLVQIASPTRRSRASKLEMLALLTKEGKWEDAQQCVAELRANRGKDVDSSDARRKDDRDSSSLLSDAHEKVAMLEKEELAIQENLQQLQAQKEVLMKRIVVGCQEQSGEATTPTAPYFGRGA